PDRPGGRPGGRRVGEQVDQPPGRLGELFGQVDDLVAATVREGRAGCDDVPTGRPDVDVRCEPAGRTANPYVAGGSEVDVHATRRGGHDQVGVDRPAVGFGEGLPPRPGAPVRVDVEVEHDQLV